MEAIAAIVPCIERSLELPAFVELCTAHVSAYYAREKQQSSVKFQIFRFFFIKAGISNMHTIASTAEQSTVVNLFSYHEVNDWYLN